MSTAKTVIVSGAFDDLKSRGIRFLEEASRLGKLTVLLWPDETLVEQTGNAPKFPLVERLYFLEAVRYVSRVIPIGEETNLDELPEENNFNPQIWADLETDSNKTRKLFCKKNNLEYRVLRAEQLSGFPEPAPMSSVPGRKKIVVTGSFDWFHSGHVRFLEEVSAFGDLYVVVGHDANIRLLKGEGHPLDQVCETGFDLQRRRLARRRPGNKKIATGHLRRERRRRQRRQARILPETRHRISRPQTHTRARIAKTQQHRPSRVLRITAST
jgi:cytidyltransferase-like protein